MFASVSVWGVLLAAVAAMIVGSVWYSSGMFGTTWKKMIGMTDEKMKKRMSAAMPMLVAMSLVSAYGLALVTQYFISDTHVAHLPAGIEMGILCGIAFGATAVFAHGAFDSRDTKLMWINAGNRVVTFLIMGAVIGYFAR